MRFNQHSTFSQSIYNKIRFAPDDGTGEAGSTENKEPGTEEKQEHFFDIYKGMWKPNIVTPDPEAQARQTKLLEDQASQLQNYVKSQTYDFGISKEKLAESIAAGNVDGVLAAIEGGMKDLHLKMLHETGKITAGSEEKLKKEADQIAIRRANVTKAEESLDAHIPFIKDKPAVRPVVQQMKAGFLGMGKTDAEANSLCLQFIEEMGHGVGLKKEDPTIPPASRTSARSPETKDPNYWADILRPNGGRGA